MSKVLVYDDIITGHHLEFIKYLFEVAKLKHECGWEFVFVLPKSIKQCDLKIVSDNVVVDYLTDHEISQTRALGYFKPAYNRSLIIRKYVNRYKVDEVFLVTLCHSMPILPFFLPRRVVISGIIYRIYFYEWNRLNLIQKVKDFIENFTIARVSNVTKAYVLNDNAAACYFNRFFKTSKFVPLVDPIQSLSTQPRDIKENIGIDINDVVFLHFGHLTMRKGTMNLIQAMEKVSSQLSGKSFIFAGVIGEDIKHNFKLSVNKLKNKGVKIYVFDEFLPQEQLNNLCFSSDCILIPYSNISYSSGVIGYTALFNKDIIGPNGGLPGKLIRRNKLGSVIDTSDIEELASSIVNYHPKEHTDYGYVQRNCVQNFIRQLF